MACSVRTSTGAGAGRPRRSRPRRFTAPHPECPKPATRPSIAGCRARSLRGELRRVGELELAARAFVEALRLQAQDSRGGVRHRELDAVARVELGHALAV